VALTTAIQPGVVLAERFRVRRRLGRGGTATVFLAEDCVLGRDVAIKRLHAEGSEADVRRFRREARLGASLIHPNLVTVFDTLSGSDGLLIVTEYVRGRPLSDLISPDGMDARRLLEILRPLASAIDYAHEHGVVHRDVKPANILIGEDRQVKLVDLGTATAGHMTQITAENEVMGTLAYIAPERLSGESVGEPACDIYSLAVVAFEALTGRPPHRADAPGELLARASQGPPDIAEALPHAPPSLAHVLAQGMDPDPDRRQHTAGAFVRELEAALGDRAVQGRPRTFAPTEPMTPPVAHEPDSSAEVGPRPFYFEPRRRRRWLRPAIVAGACLLLAGGVWLALSTGGGNVPNGNGSGQQGAAQKQAGGRSTAGSSEGGSTAADETTPPAAATPAVASAAGGAQLNEEGYSLIQEGRYAEAIPVLRRAVASFPDGTTDINYAYALYNLGHALRMNGQAEEAVPVLEQRLQIPDQTQTVRRELEAARAEASR
jgi:eukaryotic-like serine/threonine-protein kinase